MTKEGAMKASRNGPARPSPRRALFGSLGPAGVSPDDVCCSGFAWARRKVRRPIGEVRVVVDPSLATNLGVQLERVPGVREELVGLFSDLGEELSRSMGEGTGLFITPGAVGAHAGCEWFPASQDAARATIVLPSNGSYASRGHVCES
jgi:hypothetical protein